MGRFALPDIGQFGGAVLIAELAGYLLNIVLPLAGVGMGAEPCDVVVFVVFLFNRPLAKIFIPSH